MHKTYFDKYREGLMLQGEGNYSKRHYQHKKVGNPIKVAHIKSQVI